MKCRNQINEMMSCKIREELSKSATKWVTWKILIIIINTTKKTCLSPLFRVQTKP